LSSAESPEAPGQEPTSATLLCAAGQRQPNRAEAQLPTAGEFAIGSVTANAANVAWVDDSVPAGAMTSAGRRLGTVNGNPSPFAGSYAHQSALASGFTNITSRTNRTLSIGVETRSMYIYLDRQTAE
jgi:hypothetical protein